MGALDEVVLNLVTSVDEAYEFMQWLGERREVLGVDTETGGFDWWREPLRLVQFGDTQTGWAIPWERWGGVVLEALEKYKGPMVLHNTKFDVHFIEHHGGIKFPWRDLHDTRVMAHLIDSSGSTALKPLSAKLIDRKAAAMQSLLDTAMATNKWTWRTVPLDYGHYWQYAALDPVLTARLYEQFKPIIDAEYRDLYELEVEVERICLGMENRGARIDLQYCDETAEKMNRYVDETTRWVKETYGISPGTNQAVIDILQREGYEFTKHTDSGALSLDKEVLGAIPHPLAQAVLGRRRAQKVVSTYYSNFADYQLDGFIHAKMNTLAARTARMGVSEPALQTIPRHANENVFSSTVRDAFIPRDGHRLLSSDFDQIELRIFGHLCQDPAMLAAIRSGEDPFTAMARTIFSDGSITKKDPRRQTSKNATYAKFYGAGVAKFSMTAGIPFAEGEAFMNAYDMTFPGVRTFQNTVQHTAEQRKLTDGVAWVKEPSGRRHVADPGKEYTLVNYLIQGYAGTIFKMKLVELDNAGLGDFMILPIHDEILMDVPENLVEEASRQVASIMCDDQILSVPVTAGVEVYSRWGDKYRMEG